MGYAKSSKKKSQRNSPNGNSMGTSNNMKGVATELQLQAICLRLGFHSRARAVKSGWGLGGKDTQIAAWIEPGTLMFPKGLGIASCGQEGKGSGANKLPYTIWAIVEKWQAPGVIVANGNGQDLLIMREWAREQVGRKWHTTGDNNNLLGVFFSFGEFEDWLKSVKNSGRPPVVVPAAPPAAQQFSLF